MPAKKRGGGGGGGVGRGGGGGRRHAARGGGGRGDAGPKHHEAGGGEARDQPTHAHTTSPEFKATVPGRYTLKLTVTTANGVSASDTANVRADPAPAVAIDTMAPPSGGDVLTHIQVGSESYPAVASD